MWDQKVGKKQREKHSYQGDKENEDDSVFLYDSLKDSAGLQSTHPNSDPSEAEVSKISAAPLETARRNTCYLEIRDLDEESSGLYGLSTDQQHHTVYDQGLSCMGEEKENSAICISGFEGNQDNMPTVDQARKPASETRLEPKYESSISPYHSNSQKGGARKSSAAVLVPVKMEYSVYFANAHYSENEAGHVRSSTQQTVKIQQQLSSEGNISLPNRETILDLIKLKTGTEHGVGNFSEQETISEKLEKYLSKVRSRELKQEVENTSSEDENLLGLRYSSDEQRYYTQSPIKLTETNHIKVSSNESYITYENNIVVRNSSNFTPTKTKDADILQEDQNPAPIERLPPSDDLKHADVSKSHVSPLNDSKATSDTDQFETGSLSSESSESSIDGVVVSKKDVDEKSDKTEGSFQKSNFNQMRLVALHDISQGNIPKGGTGYRKFLCCFPWFMK